MKYCPKCGAPVDDSADFCPKCGNRLTPQIASFYSPADPPQPTGVGKPPKAARNQAATPGQKSANGALTVSIIGAALGTLSFVVLGFLSFPGVILCLIGLINGIKLFRQGDKKGLAALIVGAVGLLLSVIGVVLYIIVLIRA